MPVSKFALLKSSAVDGSFIRLAELEGDQANVGNMVKDPKFDERFFKGEGPQPTNPFWTVIYVYPDAIQRHINVMVGNNMMDIIYGLLNLPKLM